MIRLSKRLLFAIEAVLDIAYNGSAAPVRSAEITERQGIPRRYLEPVLQELVREKILVGIRGPSGGYRLARERRRITVGEIVRTILEDADENAPSARLKKSELGRTVIEPFWNEAEREFLTYLDGVTIEELCRRARVGGLVPEPARPLDFSI